MRKLLLIIFAIGLLVLVATQLLDLWPSRYLRWVHFATVADILFALVIAWCFHDVTNGPERNEDCYPRGDIRNDSDASD
jgi:thiosulfate reductase cytochrome b subunit